MNLLPVDFSKFRLYWPAYTMCKGCHCTNDDCHRCIELTGEPCHWVGPYLCSACVDEPLPTTSEATYMRSPIGFLDMIGNVTINNTGETTYVRPPRGLYPRFLAEEEEVPVGERIAAIAEAIKRYETAGIPVPLAWIEEYNELTPPQKNG